MKTIDKPWGKEEILSVQNGYMVKRLYMYSGKRCSLQYHEHKTETIYVLRGVLLLYLEGRMMTMVEGDCLTIFPREVHRMEGGAKEDVVYLEASTPELDDVVRVEDDYGRD